MPDFDCALHIVEAYMDEMSDSDPVEKHYLEAAGHIMQRLLYWRGDPEPPLV